MLQTAFAQLTDAHALPVACMCAHVCPAPETHCTRHMRSVPAPACSKTPPPLHSHSHGGSSSSAGTPAATASGCERGDPTPDSRGPRDLVCRAVRCDRRPVSPPRSPAAPGSPGCSGVSPAPVWGVWDGMYYGLVRFTHKFQLQLLWILSTGDTMVHRTLLASFSTERHRHRD